MEENINSSSYLLLADFTLDVHLTDECFMHFPLLEFHKLHNCSGNPFSDLINNQQTSFDVIKVAMPSITKQNFLLGVALRIQKRHAITAAVANRLRNHQRN